MSFRTIILLLFKNIEHAFLKLIKQEDKIIPYKILLEVTNLCNSKCIHCDIWKIKKEDSKKIDLQKTEVLLKSFKNNLLWLAMSGGEITTYNQFPLLIQCIKRTCPHLRIITFTTNGLIPKRVLEYALLLKSELHADVFITISLDGDNELHDHIRGIKDNYNKALETYQLLKANKINCHFGITVMPENELFVRNDFVQFNDKIKAITFVHQEGIFLTSEKNLENNFDKSIYPSIKRIKRNYKIQSLGEIIIYAYLKIALLFLKNKRSGNIIPCDVGYSSVHLMADGQLKPCMYLPSILDINKSAEWQSADPNTLSTLRNNAKKGNCTHCWMNCYAPHSMLQSPFQTIKSFLKSD